MSKKVGIISAILAGVVFASCYGLFLHSVFKTADASYRFGVGDRAWDVVAECTAVVNKVERGAPITDLRYRIEYTERGAIACRWVIERALDPLTNQVSRTYWNGHE